jgi:hypothetical protein
MPQHENKPKVSTLLLLFGMLGLGQLVVGLFVLTLLYGVVVIIFRHAFGVELWNPFH